MPLSMREAQPCGCGEEKTFLRLPQLIDFGLILLDLASQILRVITIVSQKRIFFQTYINPAIGELADSLSFAF
jgi:hypothetical protein